jgi:hypothetical protein
LRISSDNNATGALLAVLRDPIDRWVRQSRRCVVDYVI